MRSNTMTQLLKVKIIKRMLKHTFFLLAIFFLFSSCSSSKKQSSQLELSPEEKHWMEKFFSDLLFAEGGAYTLWGTKPITEIVLYHYTDEEMKALQEELSKEDKENCYVTDCYDLPSNWEKWEKIKSQFSIKKYLLFRSHFDEDGKASFAYFVDVLRTATLIQDNYELFKKSAEFDFHPLEVVIDMQNPNSVFWNKIRNSKDSPLLWGLLFGYGKLNSCAFFWKHFECPQSCQEAVDSYPFRFSNPSPRGQVRISLTNFTIPQFVSFSDDDETIIQYEKEREKIKKAYQGKDLVKITLQKLTSK